MTNFALEFWNERYSSKDYVYGTEPNQFFKEELNKIAVPGKLLLPGEGEGRNAVYAAKLNWNVDAFDQSKTGLKKAKRLAEINSVNINYNICNLTEFNPGINQYAAVAIIFVHLDESIRKSFHQKLINSLKPYGKIIIELFSKNQLGKNSGGPQDLSMLYSLDEIKRDFYSLRTLILKEDLISLNEGDKHTGEASVIRFVGQKVSEHL